MSFVDKMKDALDQSVKASKDAIKQAGEKAQQWGEMGVLKLEILQLKSQLEKMTTKLGAEVYEALIEKNVAVLSKDSSEIATSLAKVESLEKQINEKEAEFKKAGGTEDELKAENT